MSDRKPIPKSVRFEVFKRDSFTCQYCGAKSPDVVLHVDHINPVANGGDNEIVNLITSCEPCNLGKGAKELDDQSALAKQRAQLDELNERREQLEMMVEWRQALVDLDGAAVDKLEEAFNQRTGKWFSDYGRAGARKWLKRYTFAELLEALDASCDTYLREGDDESAVKALEMIPRVAHHRKRSANEPWMKDLFYIRAIARNRCSYFRDDIAIQLLKRCHAADANHAWLTEVAKTCRNWSQFRDELEEFLAEYEGGDE